jgi:hypothetical protein
VTAREQLREQVEGLSEEQARDVLAVLAVLASRRLIALHQAAPVDDEPEDEPDALAEARAQARRGETVSLADARREIGGSQTPDPLREAVRSLIRGPDRAGALAYLLMLVWLVIIPGDGVSYVVSSFSGPTGLLGESSVYFEFAIGNFVFAAICFLWLRMRRGGVDWLAKRWPSSSPRSPKATGRP